MTEVAKVAFNELYYWRIDPSTWMKHTEEVFLYISTTLCTRFPEFSWCKGDWKTQEFAKIWYPDWSRHYREPGTLTRELYTLCSRIVMTISFKLGAKPSVGKHGIDQNSAPAPKPKKRCMNKPPAAEVIEIESDDPAPTGWVITIAATPSLASPPPHTDPTLSSAADIPVISPAPLCMSKSNEPSSSNITQEPITATSHLEFIENHVTIIPTSSSIIPENLPCLLTLLQPQVSQKLQRPVSWQLQLQFFPRRFCHPLLTQLLQLPHRQDCFLTPSHSNATFPQTVIPSTTASLSATTTPILSTLIFSSITNPIIAVPPQVSSLFMLLQSNATFPDCDPQHNQKTFLSIFRRRGCSGRNGYSSEQGECVYDLFVHFSWPFITKFNPLYTES